MKRVVNLLVSVRYLLFVITILSVLSLLKSLGGSFHYLSDIANIADSPSEVSCVVVFHVLSLLICNSG